jgi:hypothetical protein
MLPALLTKVRQMSLLSLAITLGIALIRLRGVNLVFSMVSPKFITIFPMLPNPISYSESESLSLQQLFFPLVLCLLIAFLSLSNFLLNCAKDCFEQLGFSLPFLAERKLDFSVLSFSYLQQSLVLCVGYMPPCFLQRLQCFLVRAFLGTLAVDLVPGFLFPFLSQWIV